MATTHSSVENNATTAPPVRSSELIHWCRFPTWIGTTETSPNRRFWIAAIAILAFGASLRVVGLFDDFWLDEIWSWSLARSAKSVGQIFIGLHHDNNNYLNTLWIYACGDQPHWFVYRLHSYVAGIVTIIGCGWLAGDVAFARRADIELALRPPGSTRLVPADRSECAQFARMACLVTIFLLATCHMACVYSTEARGYSLAGAAAVFSTLVLRRAVLDSSSRVTRFILPPAYAGLAIVGFLSHLSFVAVFAPQLTWSTILLVRRWRFLRIAICHLPPIIVVAVLWWFDLRFAQVGDGPRLSLLDVCFQVLALPTGAVSPDWLVLLCGGIVLVGLIMGFVAILRQNPTDAWLFGMLLLFAPLVMIGIAPAGLFYPRHLFVAWMSLFPLLGISLVQIGARIRGRWPLLFFGLACWTATNGWEFCQFATYGRGGYARAVDWLVAETRRDVESMPRRRWIGSDHDFRNRMLLFFYQQRIPPDVPLGYLPNEQWPVEGVDWLIVHSLDREFSPEQELQIGQLRYDLAHLERFAAPIGWHWAIYRRRDQRPANMPTP